MPNSMPIYGSTEKCNGGGASALTCRFRSRGVPPIITLVLALCGTFGHATVAATFDPPSDAPGAAKSDQPSAPSTKPAPAVVIVEGQVTDQVGGGQAGVTVTLMSKADAGESGAVVATVTTNEVGDFSIKASEKMAGVFVITFSKPKYRDLTRDVRLGEGDYPPYLAEALKGDLVVQGRVLDVRTDKPVAEAAVEMQSVESNWHATSDAAGAFKLDGVLPGAAELFVEADGFGRERIQIKDVESVGEVVIHLKPERILHIVVVDDRDQPISGASLEVYDQPREDFRSAVTGADGKVTLRGIHFDARELSLQITHEDYVSSGQFDRAIETPETVVESTHRFIMTQAGRLTGTVVEAESGSPVYGARVMTGDGSSDTSPRDWVSYDGTYSIAGVATGVTVVTVHREGYAPALRVLEVQPGKVVEADFKLKPGAVVTGIVKDADGKLVADAYVDTTRWRDHATLGLRAITDSDGKFTIESAPMDAFEVSVRGPGTGATTQTVKAGGDPIEIILPEAAVVMAKVKPGDKVPDVALTTLDGETIKLAELPGKTVLIDFWATWCGPCVAEIPHLLETNAKFGARKDFTIVSVSLDDDESALRRFIKKKKMDWRHVFGGKAGAQKAAEAFGVVGIPALFLIGPDGRIKGADLGGPGLVKQVEKALQTGGSP